MAAVEHQRITVPGDSSDRGRREFDPFVVLGGMDAVDRCRPVNGRQVAQQLGSEDRMGSVQRVERISAPGPFGEAGVKALIRQRTKLLVDHASFVDPQHHRWIRECDRAVRQLLGQPHVVLVGERDQFAFRAQSRPQEVLRISQLVLVLHQHDRHR